MQMQSYENIDEYIANFSPDQQTVLRKMRETIKEAAPEATEKISYGIPTYTLNGPLVHFAAYDHHYAFYPGSGGVEAFKDELRNYDTSKGTIRFPVNKPIPYDLIKNITVFRAAQNQKG